MDGTIRLQTITRASVGKNSAIRFNFLFPVQQEGLYYLKFRVPNRVTEVTLFGMKFTESTRNEDEELFKAMLGPIAMKESGPQWTDGVFLKVDFE